MNFRMLDLYLYFYNLYYPDTRQHFLVCREKGCNYRNPEYGINNHRTHCFEHKTNEMFNAAIFTEFEIEIED